MSQNDPIAARDLRDPCRIGRPAVEISEQGFDVYAISLQGTREDSGAEVFVQEENNVRRPARSAPPPRSDGAAVGTRPPSRRWSLLS